MKIKSIHREQFQGKVYNFHCLPNENYFSHNVLVHNCYKGNLKGSTPENMTLETFSKIIQKFPSVQDIHTGEKFFPLNQIAFGITSIGTHPELFDIFRYCRSIGVIPNVTINGADPLTQEQMETLISLTGAMAISISKPNYEKGLDLISKLLSMGARQLNIHCVISSETIDIGYKLCDAFNHDPRMKGLNAIVFLGLKPKERGQKFGILKTNQYIKLVEYCLDNNVRFGFDSCSSPKAELSVIKSEKLTEEKKKEILQCCERCESGIFSGYADRSGKYWHCSFGEGMEIAYGIDLTEINDFMSEVWFSKPMSEWRSKLIGLERECPLYPEIRIQEDEK